MASVKFIAVSRGLKHILDYVTNREKTTDSLVTGVNCVAQTALDEFEAVKAQFRKTDGRSYYHIVQAFSPDDPLDFETAHEIGLQFASYFSGYQCVVATHMNTRHIHNHIVLNSVNFENGLKFHQSANEMRQAKEFSNDLCHKYGLSVTEAKASKFEMPTWKKKLRRAIKNAMEMSYDRDELIFTLFKLGGANGIQCLIYRIIRPCRQNQICRLSVFLNLQHHRRAGALKVDHLAGLVDFFDFTRKFNVQAASCERAAVCVHMFSAEESQQFNHRLAVFYTRVDSVVVRI
jgi:hypothetical protein